MQENEKTDSLNKVLFEELILIRDEKHMKHHT